MSRLISGIIATVVIIVLVIGGYYYFFGDSAEVRAAKAQLKQYQSADAIIGINEQTLATKSARGTVDVMTHKSVMRNKDFSKVMCVAADGKAYPYVLAAGQAIRILSMAPEILKTKDGGKSPAMLYVTTDDPDGQFTEGFTGYVLYSHTGLYNKLLNDPINFHAKLPSSYVPDQTQAPAPAASADPTLGDGDTMVLIKKRSDQVIIKRGKKVSAAEPAHARMPALCNYSNGMLEWGDSFETSIPVQISCRDKIVLKSDYTTYNLTEGRWHEDNINNGTIVLNPVSKNNIIGEGTLGTGDGDVPLRLRKV